MRIFRPAIVLPVLIGLAACGEPPTKPEPIPDAPTLSCPASITLASPDGSPQPATFTVPTAAGGQPPVPVTCSAQPGSPFPLGSTIVTCSATDALARQASCNFNVTVTAVPRISKTKFLAFGDSITYGRCGPKPAECPPYTARLDELLRERYTAQTFTVTNKGLPGEKAADGQDRLPGEIIRSNPEVLLLMEGTNDILATPYQESAAIGALEDMIVFARDRGVAVFLATVPPIVPGGPNDFAAERVPGYNALVKEAANRRGATLVDIHAVLSANLTRYYVGDDVHPTGEGLRVIGETFYAAVRAAFDNTPTDMSPAFSPASSSLFQSPLRKRR